MMLLSLLASVAGIMSAKGLKLMTNAYGYKALNYGDVCTREGNDIGYLVRSVLGCRQAAQNLQEACYYGGKRDDHCASNVFKKVYEINYNKAPMGCFFTNDYRGPKLWFNVNHANFGTDVAKPICQFSYDKDFRSYGQGKVSDKCEICGDNSAKALWHFPTADRYFGLDSELISCGKSCVGDGCFDVDCKPNGKRGDTFFSAMAPVDGRREVQSSSSRSMSDRLAAGTPSPPKGMPAMWLVMPIVGVTLVAAAGATIKAGRVKPIVNSEEATLIA